MSALLAAAAAHHEAGHAVAAGMRGGASLTSVAVDLAHGTGLTQYSAKPCDWPFLAFAGPYAEARYAWGDLALDDEDDDGLDFHDYLNGVLLFCQTSDRQAVGERAGDRATLSVWMMELDRAWPEIRIFAQGLLR